MTTTVEITDADARAVAHLRGAHVTSWSASPGDERLYLSARSSFEPGAAIRGGVPVIFPQFSTFGPLPKHGFARTAEWTLADSTSGSATFRLADSPATRALWPHAFVAELTVRVADRLLELAFTVHNSGAAPFDFAAALHSYIRVNDIGQARVRGLEGHRYRDSAAGGAEGLQRESELSISGQVDRIYLDATQVVGVHEPGRVTTAGMTGFRDVVVWNPGPAAALPDMEPDGYKRMLCVEAAVIGRPVRVAPGEQWTGTQTLTAE